MPPAWMENYAGNRWVEFRSLSLATAVRMQLIKARTEYIL